MDVVEQLLVPGVQHGGEAELPAQAILGIGGKGLQRLGGTVEEQVVQAARVGRQQVVELVGQGEDVVEVADRQQLRLTVGQPARPGQALALGAMAIAARIVNRPLVPTVITAFQMAAQGRRATAFDSGHDALVFQRQWVPLPIGGAVEAEDIGDLVGGTAVDQGRVHEDGHGGPSVNEGRWDRSRRSSGLRV